MKIYNEASLSNFEFWSGARDRAKQMWKIYNTKQEGLIMEITRGYDCKEIATVLCRLSTGNNTVDVETAKDVEKAIEQLQATAQNEYNSDYYRTLWEVLQNIASFDF